MKLVKDPWPWQTDPEKREEYRRESLDLLLKVDAFYGVRTRGSGATDYWSLYGVVDGDLRGLTCDACNVGLRTVDSPATGWRLTTRGYGLSHLGVLRYSLEQALGKPVKVEELG